MAHSIKKKQLKLVSELRQVGRYRTPKDRYPFQNRLFIYGHLYFKLRQHLTSDGYYFITTFFLPHNWDLTTKIKYDRQVKKLTSLYL